MVTLLGSVHLPCPLMHCIGEMKDQGSHVAFVGSVTPLEIKVLDLACLGVRTRASEHVLYGLSGTRILRQFIQLAPFGFICCFLTMSFWLCKFDQKCSRNSFLSLLHHIRRGLMMVLCFWDRVWRHSPCWPWQWALAVFWNTKTLASSERVFNVVSPCFGVSLL